MFKDAADNEIDNDFEVEEQSINKKEMQIAEPYLEQNKADIEKDESKDSNSDYDYDDNDFEDNYEENFEQEDI